MPLCFFLAGAKVIIIFEITKKYPLFLQKIVKIRVIRVIRGLFLVPLQSDLQIKNVLWHKKMYLRRS